MGQPASFFWANQISFSLQRFPEGPVCSATGLGVSVHGAVGETVSVSAIGGGAGAARLRVKAVTLGASGIAQLAFP
jgi:hypothetical protein